MPGNDQEPVGKLLARRTRGYATGVRLRSGMSGITAMGSMCTRTETNSPGYLTPAKAMADQGGHASVLQCAEGFC